MVGPVDISFQNLTVSVYDKAQGERKTILHNVSGVARSGRLLALMGASGAGKTTLVRPHSLHLQPLGRLSCAQ